MRGEDGGARNGVSGAYWQKAPRQSAIPVALGRGPSAPYLAAEGREEEPGQYEWGQHDQQADDDRADSAPDTKPHGLSDRHCPQEQRPEPSDHFAPRADDRDEREQVERDWDE